MSARSNLCARTTERSGRRLGASARRLGLAVAALGLLAVPSAAAQSTPTLSEVMVTDASGLQLMGYGAVVQGHLSLTLDSGGQPMVVVLIDNEGTVETLRATQAADGTLLVRLPDGSQLPFATYLSEHDVKLTVTPATAAAPTHAAPPAKGGKPAQAATPTHPTTPPASKDNGSDQPDASPPPSHDGADGH